MNKTELATAIVENVGGKDNIESVISCSTRLRFVLKNKKSANKQKLSSLTGVYGVAEGNGQFQVVIGSNVGDIHKEVVQIIGEETVVSSGNKKFGSKVLDYVSNAFIPMVPALVGSGMLKGFLALFVSLKWLAAGTPTYAVFSAAGNAVFYFIPFLIAYNTAKYLKTNVLVAMVIVGALVEPNFVALASVTDKMTLFGLPLTVINYSSLILPALVMTPILSIIEKTFKKWTPKSLQLLIVPFLSILIMVPLLILIIGPLSVAVSKVISDFSLWLNATSPVALGIVVGGTVGYLTMFGIHLSLLPVILLNFTTFGYDPVLAFMSATCYAQIGVALAIFVRSKNAQMKSLAGASSLTAILSGITEPILFGLAIEYKWALAIIGIAGAVGGGIMGFFGAAAHGFVNAGVLGLPGYYSAQFPYYVLAIVTTTVVSFVLMNLFAFGKKDTAVVVSTDKQDFINSPINGSVVSLSNVNDNVFASEMVGKGVAIRPTDGKVFAPADAEVVSLLPSNHAIGLKLQNGAELLIHVGLNIVQLEGKYFTPHVKQGDKVKAGDLLLEFDIAKIVAAGYDIVSPIIVTNSKNFKDVYPLAVEQTKHGEKLLGLLV